jgi:POT family proton-dependent oligopeptide transporter
MAFFQRTGGFLLGAVVLALGTGIFKPGIQDTLVKRTNPQDSTMAWGCSIKCSTLAVG